MAGLANGEERARDFWKSLGVQAPKEPQRTSSEGQAGNQKHVPGGGGISSIGSIPKGKKNIFKTNQGLIGRGSLQKEPTSVPSGVWQSRAQPTRGSRTVAPIAGTAQGTGDPLLAFGGLSLFSQTLRPCNHPKARAAILGPRDKGIGRVHTQHL